MEERSLNLNGLTQARRKGRFEAVAPLIQLFDLPSDQRFPHLLPDGERAWTLTEAASWCAKHNGCSVRTIWRTIAAFKRGGEGALERAFRRDKGSSRFFDGHEKAAILAAYLHLAWHPTLRAIHEAIVAGKDRKA